MIARLNAMRYVLSLINYEGKKKLKAKKWSKEDPIYELVLNKVRFKNLTKEQYDLLYRIKANEQ